MSPDDLWAKALAAAESARTLLEHGDGDGATSRAYYAMFNAARAMLWFTHGVEPGEAKTHATVIRRFSKHFVQNGPLDAEYGRLLMEAAQARMVADYDEAVGVFVARQRVEAMSRFLDALSKLKDRA